MGKKESKKKKEVSPYAKRLAVIRALPLRRRRRRRKCGKSTE